MKQIVANTLRVLSCQMVEAAGSGHPGLPLGFADALTALLYEISYDASDPNWINRDRIIFSPGHGCALWYSALYGLGLRTREDLAQFRQLGSNTPGHLEHGLGIEVTTGPLGMGFAWGIGLAFGERLMNARNKAIDHYTFIICSDGDLMEGVSYEAAAIAGQYNLHKIIALWDDNSITIDGPTTISRNENVRKRFESQGWEYIAVDGNDIQAVQTAIRKAKTHDKPTLIACKTIIGKYSMLADTSKVHGAPLGSENFEKLKISIEHDEAAFFNEFEKIKMLAKAKATEWKKLYKNKDFIKEIKLEKIDELKQLLAQPLATRQHSQNILEHLINANDNIIIASADLSTSCGTKPKSGRLITATDFSGNILPCGVRENAMVAIMGGITLHSSLQGVASTFLVFSDYARPAIRLAALMNVPVVLIATHDSVALGEDGPTHQPIEHLDSLRCMPNLLVARPADGFETFYCYERVVKVANDALYRRYRPELAHSVTAHRRGLSHHDENLYETNSHQSEAKCTTHIHPTILVLTRQNLPSIHKNFITQQNLVFDKENEKNGYIISCGSELSLALQVGKKLKKTVISMPFFEKKEINLPALDQNFDQRTACIHIVEASSGMCWNYLFNQAKIFNIKSFGESGKQSDLLEHFGFTPENLLNWVASKG